MISFIVPVYNVEHKLQRCIESILKQSETDIELLLIDDGSKDGSGEICDKYKENEKVRVYHNENQGVSKTRNFGIKHARGEYIIFVDSDDFLNIDTGKKLKESLEKNNSDIVLCGFCHWSTIRQILVLPPRELCGTFSREEFAENFSVLYGKLLLNSPCNKIYKKEQIKKGFREDLDLGEDFLFNLDYFSEINSITIIQDCLYNYVQSNENSLSGKFRNNQKEISKMIHKAASEFLMANGVKSKGKEIDEIFLYDLINSMEKLPLEKNMSKKEKKEAISSYVTDPYVIQVSRQTDLPIVEYKIINYALRFRLKKVIWQFCCMKKCLLKLLQGLQKGKNGDQL